MSFISRKSQINHRLKVHLSIIICSILFSFISKLHSQFVFDKVEESEYELIIERFHFEDGLKSIRIFDIYSDQNDLIWIVTESSLYTFNGFSFEQIINFGKLRSHPTKIFKDNNQNLWLIEPLTLTTNKFESTIAKEVQILNGSTYETINVKDYIGESLAESFNFYQSNEGIIYFNLPSNPTNYYSFDIELEKEPFIAESNQFNFIEVDNFISYRDCESIYIKSDTFNIDTSFKLNGPFLNFRIQNEVFSYAEKQDYDILIQSFYKNNLETLRTFHHAYDVDFRGNIFAFQHRSFESSDPQLFQWLSEGLNKINSFVYQSILIDAQGNMWVGSHLGLMKISKREVLFKNISGNGLASTRNLLRLNKDTIVVCAYDGIFVYDLNQKVLEKKSNEVLLSISKIDNKLIVFDKLGKNKILKYPSFSLENSLDMNNAVETQIIGSGDINENEVLLLTEKNLIKYNCLTKEVTNIKGPKNFIKYHSLIEHQNELYICSSIGVSKFLKSSNSLQSVLSGYEINYVHFDYQNPDIVWLASTLGLLKFNKKTKQLKIIGNEDGLSNTSITSIKEDQYGALWIPTFTGLNRYDKVSEKLNHYYTQDGIINNEFNHYSDLTIDKQTFLFGGTNGITIIKPEKFLKQNANSSFSEVSILSGTKIKNNSSATKLDVEKIEINNEINFYENDIELRLTLHHPFYNNLRSKELLYKISDSSGEKYLNNWTTLKSNILNISRRPYGNYQLEIKAISRGGDQLSTIKKYDLIYLRPFYKKSSFLSILFLGLFLLFLYLLNLRDRTLAKKTTRLEEEIQNRTKLIKDQNLKLDKMNKTKDKLFAILAHDLKSPLITLQNLAGKIKYLIETNQIERISDIGHSIDEKLSRLSAFLDNLLNWSLQQRNHLSYKPAAVNISKLMEEIIQLYEEHIRAKKLQIQSKIDSSHFYFADKNSVHAVVRNVFNNALKYSYNGAEIKIESIIQPDEYILRIIDHGLGISQERINSIKRGLNIDSHEGTKGEKGTGLGLIVSQELMKLNLGKLDIHRNKQNGTTVELRFPKAEVKKEK